MGMVRYSKPKQFQDGRHALLYATKYVVKWPEKGFPDWVMNYKGRVRRFSTSRHFWGVMPPTNKPEKEGPTRPERTHAERIKLCCIHSRVLAVEERVNQATGELVRKKQWIDRITAPVGNLWACIEQLQYHENFRVFWKKGSSICYPGNWKVMREELADAWRVSGHEVNRSGGMCRFALSFEKWMIENESDGHAPTESIP